MPGQARRPQAAIAPSVEPHGLVPPARISIAEGTEAAPLVGVERAWLVAAYVAIILAPLASLVVIFATSMPGALNDILADDAFFYLGIARNLWLGNGPSFGGLVATNGFHPLWLAMITPLYAFGTDADTIRVAVMALSSALWLVAGYFYWQVADRLFGAMPALLASPLLVHLATYGTGGSIGVMFMGMEGTILIPLLLATFHFVIRDGLFEVQPPQPGALLRLGVLLALLVLARLDMVLCVACVLAVFAVRRRGAAGTARWRDSAILALPTLATVAGYAIINLIVFGTAAPVSGQAKSIAGLQWMSDPLVAALWGSSTRYVTRLPTGLVALAGIALIAATGIGAMRRQRNVANPLTLWLALLGGHVIQLLYMASVAYWGFGPWYGALRAALIAVAAPAAIWALLARLPTLRRGAGVALAGAVILGVGAAATTKVVSRAHLDANLGSPWVQLAHQAESLKTTLPPDAVIAIGDFAGQFGFRVARPIVQLEGLTEDAEFLTVFRDHERYHAYLGRRGVTHVAAMLFQLVEDEHLPSGCGVLVEPKYGVGPKGRIAVCEADRLASAQPTFAIWRYRPDLQALIARP